MVTLPKPLRKGSTFGIWTPSSPAPYLFPNRYKRSITEIKKQGYQVIEGASCLQNQSFAPNSAQRLAEEFHKLYLQADAILFSTGGYTTISVLPYINWHLVMENPKPIIGYSDATVFLLACYHRSDMVTFHGPMLVSEWGEYEGMWDYTLENFEKTLQQRNNAPLVPPKQWTDEILWWDKEDTRKRVPTEDGIWKFLKSGYGIGPLVGGNIPTLSLLLGTPYFPSLKGSILFLEAHGQSPDHFYSYLMQLKISGEMDDLKGLIIGRHAQPKSTTSGFSSFEEIINLVCSSYSFPILIDVDLGHTEPMLTLPIGGLGKLDSEQNEFSLLLNEG